MIPLLATVGLGLGTYWFLGGATWLTDEILRQAASAQASVAVTMLGFMLAMLAILVSLSDRRLIRNMNKTGHFTTLLRKLYIAAAYFGAFMLAALACLFLECEGLRVGTSVSIGLLSGASFQLMESGHRLWRVLDLLNPRDNSPLE